MQVTPNVGQNASLKDIFLHKNSMQYLMPLSTTNAIILKIQILEIIHAAIQCATV